MELPNWIVRWLEKIPMPNAVRNIFDVGLETVLEYQRDDVPRMGAALAYYTLFSLFPLLLLVISLVGYLLKAGVSLAVHAEGRLLEVVSLTLPQAGHFLAEALQTAESRSGEVGLVGMVILLWSAANVFAQLDRTFQVIWDVQDSPPFWRSPLVGFLMVFMIFLLLLVAMMGTVALDVALRLIQQPSYRGFLWKLMVWGGSFLLTVAIFAGLYRYLPRAKVHWRDVWPAALMAALAWEVLKWGFGWYVSQADYGAIYGSVGSVIALLTWVYLSSQVLFLGGELVAVRGQRRQQREQPSHG